MCKPIEGLDVSAEIMSALSALNMPPKPIENPQGPYLIDKDQWVQHSREHLRQAMRNMNNVHSKIEDLKYTVLRLTQKHVGNDSVLEVLDEIADKLVKIQ